MGEIIMGRQKITEIREMEPYVDVNGMMRAICPRCKHDRVIRKPVTEANTCTHCGLRFRHAPKKEV